VKKNPNDDAGESSKEESMLDMIRRIGDLAMEETKREMAQPPASETQKSSGLLSHATRREMSAQMVLRDGLASSIEEARKMVDEAI
jgi:hypothetical protein